MKLKFRKFNKHLMPSRILGTTIYSNDQVGIVNDACSICWDKSKDKTFEEKLNYIKKRVAIGHESVLEHSNIIMLVVIPNNDANIIDLFEVVENCKYLNIKIRRNDNDTFLLIGGSVRGYKHIFRNVSSVSKVLNNIFDNLQNASYVEFFDDFVNDNVITDRFIKDDIWTRHNSIIDGNVNIINIDPIETIYNNINDIVPNVFTYDDLLDMCTVTILFKNMSRTATHQLVRHRNAITQESQRYVDYSDAEFISPDTFKEEYKDKQYTLKMFDIFIQDNMKNIGKEMVNIYNALREQGVLKEDARAFLPSNIACKNLYMTFTYRSLIKFLELRTDKAAQSEIRSYANIIYTHFSEIVKPIMGDDIYTCLLPLYSFENDLDYSNIDEPVEE